MSEASLKPGQRTPPAGLQPLTPEQVQDFLSERRNAVIATINTDGTPQLTPVNFYWDGTTFSVMTAKGRVKYKNITRDPRIHITVDDSLGHRAVMAKGQAQLIEEHEAVMAMARTIAAKYYGPKHGPAYLERMAQVVPDLVLVRLTPERVHTLGKVSTEELRE